MSVLAQPGDTALRLRLAKPFLTSATGITPALCWSSRPVKAAKGASSAGFGAEVPVQAQVTGTQVLAGQLLERLHIPEGRSGRPGHLLARVHQRGQRGHYPRLPGQCGPGAKSVVFANASGDGSVPPDSIAVLQLNWPGHATQSQPLGGYQARLFGQLQDTQTGRQDHRDSSWCPMGACTEGARLGRRRPQPTRAPDMRRNPGDCPEHRGTARTTDLFRR